MGFVTNKNSLVFITNKRNHQFLSRNRYREFEITIHIGNSTNRFVTFHRNRSTDHHVNRIANRTGKRLVLGKNA